MCACVCVCDSNLLLIRVMTTSFLFPKKIDQKISLENLQKLKLAFEVTASP